ncbi:hypothetical protein FOA52_006096 [Chlamydomonas sp. UWO 241]|nr:hypothetical protein FOA52_006096 [Chlamydomonas sp. UWO 241]
MATPSPFRDMNDAQEIGTSGLPLGVSDWAYLGSSASSFSRGHRGDMSPKPKETGFAQTMSSRSTRRACPSTTATNPVFDADGTEEMRYLPSEDAFHAHTQERQGSGWLDHIEDSLGPNSPAKSMGGSDPARSRSLNPLGPRVAAVVATFEERLERHVEFAGNDARSCPASPQREPVQRSHSNGVGTAAAAAAPSPRTPSRLGHSLSTILGSTPSTSACTNLATQHEDTGKAPGGKAPGAKAPPRAGVLSRSSSKVHNTLLGNDSDDADGGEGSGRITVSRPDPAMPPGTFAHLAAPPPDLGGCELEWQSEFAALVQQGRHAEALFRPGPLGRRVRCCVVRRKTLLRASSFEMCFASEASAGRPFLCAKADLRVQTTSYSLTSPNSAKKQTVLAHVESTADGFTYHLKDRHFFGSDCCVVRFDRDANCHVSKMTMAVVVPGGGAVAEAQASTALPSPDMRRSDGSTLGAMLYYARKGDMDPAVLGQRVALLGTVVPAYDAGSDTYLMDFGGRVCLGSVKNCQLGEWRYREGPDAIVEPAVLLTGRNEHDAFALDFAYPLCAMTAMTAFLSRMRLSDSL